MIPRPHDSHMETRPAHGRDCVLPDPHFTAAFSMGSIQQKWNSAEGRLPKTDHTLLGSQPSADLPSHLIETGTIGSAKSP